LYTIHSVYGGQGFPLLFCFLDGKTEDAYTHMLSTIKRVLEERDILFKPKKVQIDFEYATFNATSRVFPEAIIKGCFSTLDKQFGEKYKNWD
jgi:hypothetical protein